MAKIKQKKLLLNKIINAAQSYKKNLVGKTFLIVFDERYIEILFRKQEFSHLTGVDKKISAKDFYKEAVRGTLQYNQFFFSQRFPSDLSKKKINNLDKIYQAMMSEGFILEDITTTTQTYKFGFTELNFTLCLGEDTNANNQIKSNYFIAQSFRIDDDCFSRSKSVYDIQYIFEKENDEKLYEKVLFCTDDSELERIPESVKHMLK